MEKIIFKKLSRSEAFSCEAALHHLLCRFENARSNDSTEAICGYTVVNHVMLSSDDVLALRKLRETLYNKLYD